MTTENEDQEIVRAAMSILGSRTSAKKKRSSRRNALKSRGVPRKKRKKELRGERGKNLAEAYKTDNQQTDHNTQRRIKRRRKKKEVLTG